MSKGERFPHLFESFQIGNMHLNNRIVMAPMETCFALESGEVSDRIIDYYRERAKGGAGWIIVESTYIHKSGRARKYQIGVDTDEKIPGLKRLVDSVHSFGAKISLQICHAGRQANPQLAGGETVAPSAIPSAPNGVVPRPLRIEEIDNVIDLFGKAAVRAREAGFDGVEIHGAHGYLIHEFMSPLSNQRTDSYGGTLENRKKFALEVLNEVKNQVGKDITIDYRISASDYAEGGLTLEETVRAARDLEAGGIQALSVSAGMAALAEGGYMVVPPMAIPRGVHLPLAEAMRKALNIPIIAVGRINTPELAEKSLAEGKADLIATGRPFLCDPHWPSKARAGDIKAIRRCIACNDACTAKLALHEPIMCVQNPMLGKEGEIEIKSAPEKKKVFIVGGGPGGLEAARICALRGHEVTLYEKEKQLGGKLLSAVLPPHKEEVGGILEYQIDQINALGIDVRLDTEVDETLIENSKPDVAIIATGSIANDMGLHERIVSENPNVFFAEDVLQGRDVKGERIAVIGGGMIGCEVAEFMLQKGKKLSIIEMLDDVALDMNARGRTLLLKRFAESKNIEMLTGLKVREVKDKEVIAERHDQTITTVKADGIILAVGYRPNDELFNKLKDKVSHIFSIGDCVKARRAFEAIREGFEVGLKV